MARTRFRRLRYLYTFFPVQLLLLHVRRSFIFLLFWLLLFGMAGGWFLKAYGISYLFTTPEYLSEVSSLSYFIMGFVLGLFVMAFHITSYILYSYRYTFLATLRRPLYRFSINNSIIPVLFYIIYSAHIYRELTFEGYGFFKSLFFVAAMQAGSIVSIALAFSYFFGTTGKKNDEEENKATNPLSIFIKKRKNIEADLAEDFVFTYLRNFHTIRLVRSSSHYDDEQRLKTLQQHHLSAALYFIALLAIMLGLSWLGNHPFFMIPAGASIVLMLTMYLMIFGAVFSWLRTWTFSVLTISLFALNYFSTYPNFQRLTYAPGMDYTSEPAPYTYAHLEELSQDSIQAHDIEQMIVALEGWKARQSAVKPRLVILNSSGGGLRSALFTMGMLQYLDSISLGRFLNSVFFMTGSSGGMIGASYYRELWMQHKQGIAHGLSNSTYFDKIGSDILNPVGFTLVMNDFFITTRKHKAGGFTYPFDRGTAFDLRLSQNLNDVLSKPIFAYRDYEQSGKIPLLILAPTIINEGRRLIMSPMGTSFLTRANNHLIESRTNEIDGIEFSRFFKNQQADSLKFITALRMSSTFPYITPLISLPSNPKIEVIDAGARDNDGLLLTLRLLYAVNDWVEENTSGVTIVQLMAARPLEPEIRQAPVSSRFKVMIKPIGGMFSSFGSLQLFSRAEMLTYAQEWMNFDMEIIQFDLLTRKNEISLSWHLTDKEKIQIYNSIRQPRFNEAYKKVSKAIH